MPEICSTKFDGNNVFGDCLRYHTERPFRVLSLDMDIDVCAECVKEYEQSRHWRTTPVGGPWKGLDQFPQDDGAIHLFDGSAELFCIIPAGERAQSRAESVIAAFTPKEASDDLVTVKHTPADPSPANGNKPTPDYWTVYVAGEEVSGHLSETDADLAAKNARVIIRAAFATPRESIDV